MTTRQLRNHMEHFDKRKGNYLVSADGENFHAHAWLADRQIALQLCETAQRPGHANSVRLHYFPNPDSEQLLFDA